MKIFLTGASGFLGNRLLESLVHRDRLSLKILQHRKVVICENCEIVKGGLSDPEILSAAVKGVDTVVHVAALTHSHKEDEYFRVNSAGTKNLVKAAEKMGVRRFVYVSSFAAHPQGGSYAVSKLEGEKHVKQSTLSWVIIRPSEVYGDRSSDAINKLIQWIKIFKIVPVLGKGHYSLSPIFIQDLLLALVRIIFDESFKDTTFALTGPEVIKYSTLIDRIGRFVHIRPIRVHIPVFIFQVLIRVILIFKKDFFFSDQIPRLLCDKQTYNQSSEKLPEFYPKNIEEGLAYFLNPSSPSSN